MKKTMSLLAMLLFIGGIYAQESAIKDKKEETVTTKLVVNNGKTVEKITVKKETTTQKGKVQLEDSEDHYENQKTSYVASESKKTVRINNNIAAYEKLAKTQYYICENKRYSFTQDEGGFFISYYQNNKYHDVAYLRATSAKDHFLVSGEEFDSGIGYFDEHGNLTIEYPSDATGKMITKTYTIVK